MSIYFCQEDSQKCAVIAPVGEFNGQVARLRKCYLYHFKSTRISSLSRPSMRICKETYQNTSM